MEIILKREVLSNTLQNINSVVDKSTTKPILSNFVIRTVEGKDRKVEFSSTDYELSLVELVNAEIKEQGSICVNAKKYLILSRNCRQKMSTYVQQNSCGSILYAELQKCACRL